MRPYLLRGGPFLSAVELQGRLDECAFPPLAANKGFPRVIPEETVLARVGLVDLWYFPYEETESRDPALWDSYSALLHAKEWPRHDRFVYPRGRVLRGPPLPNVSALHLNLSNAHGLVICTVSTLHAQLGADVERMDRVEQPMDIAEHFSSSTEITALRRLPTDQQRERFFSYWMLKESYIKARRLGLNLPLKDFSIVR